MAKKLRREERIEVKRSKKGAWQMATVDALGADMNWNTVSKKFDFAAVCDKNPGTSWFYNYADEGKTWRRYVDLNKPLKDVKLLGYSENMVTLINDVHITIEVRGQRYVAHVTQELNKFAADFPEDAAIGAYAAYVMLQRRKA